MPIQDVIKSARERHRTVIEQLYEDSCTVVEYQDVKDPITKVKSKQEVTVLTDQPCKLSFENVESTGEEDNVATVAQSVKLFINPTVAIKAGSKITVTHNNEQFVYKCSSEPSKPYTHQEISLELFKEWA